MNKYQNPNPTQAPPLNSQNPTDPLSPRIIAEEEPAKFLTPDTTLNVMPSMVGDHGAGAGGSRFRGLQ